MLRYIKIMTLLMLALPLPEVQAQQHVLTLDYRYEAGGTEPRLMASSEAAYRLLDSLSSDRFTVDSVCIVGWASPESSVTFNDGLSGRRASAVGKILASHPAIGSAPLKLRGGGENWAPVVEWLRTTSDSVVLPWRDTMLFIIQANPELDRREWVVRQLGEGKPWERVREASYPAARMVNVTLWYTEIVQAEPLPEPVVVEEPPAEPVAPAEPVEIVEPQMDTVPQPRVEYDTTVVSNWNWELHTNLLVPAMNVGAGVMLGGKKRFSLAADWYFPWIWPPKENRWCFELLALGLEGRWYFRDGSDPLLRGTGPSVGLGVMAGYFDFERKFKGFQGEFIAPEVDFRWTFPIRQGRWRLALGIGAGYLRARTRDYVVYREYGDLYRTGEYTNYINYFGPLRADVSLTIPLWYDKTYVQEVTR